MHAGNDNFTFRAQYNTQKNTTHRKITFKIYYLHEHSIINFKEHYNLCSCFLDLRFFYMYKKRNNHFSFFPVYGNYIKYKVNQTTDDHFSMSYEIRLVSLPQRSSSSVSFARCRSGWGWWSAPTTTITRGH